MKKFRCAGNAFGLLPLLLLAVVLPAGADNDFPTDFQGADANVGERLFLETRFSQYFFTNCGGDVNTTLPGDPTVATLNTTAGAVPGPFAGQAMSCRQCHLVDEEGYGPFGNNTLGNRTYADFARRSPIPARDDGRTETPRNSPTLVDAFIPRPTPLFLHLDGQFASAHDLIIGTLTGRNYGWKPDEYATAAHHIANVIRNDDGMGYLATEARGGRFQIEDTYLATYSNIFAGFSDYEGSYIWDPRALTADLISPEYRLDMRVATDDQILDTVASLIEAYLRNLYFSQDTNGLDFEGAGTAVFKGSPFDVFLVKNQLPRIPAPGETDRQYSRRLLQLVNQLPNPQFVTNLTDGAFVTQTQSFQFGPTELAGLKIFLTDQDSAGTPAAANIGNCAACHPPPAFTDFIFHNTGAAQDEYEAVHGAGTFNQLAIPGLAARLTNYDAFLPPTTNHPAALGRFETAPTSNDIAVVDLGLWNVYANPDFPAPQAGLQEIVPQLMGMTVPQMDSARLSGRTFTFSGTNGVPGATYYILASGPAPSGIFNWSIIATNAFDPQGHFSFSAPASDSASQIFYKLSLLMPTPAEVLPRTIALFKTPTLRDLGQSGPYLHTGQKDSLEEMIQFYEQVSNEARQGQIRNADPELMNIYLNDDAIAPLAAFLQALNEDYTD